MTSDGQDALRLFVAIELPETWLAALGEVQEGMKAAVAGSSDLRNVRLRWVRPEGIHLTLKFIGEVEPERLQDIRGQLAYALREPPDVTLTLTRIGSFSHRRAPRVVWAGVDTEPPQALLPLYESVETWLAAAGVPREHGGFKPHLTLARLPYDLTDAQRQRAAEITGSLTVPDVAPFTVRSVSLIQSFLGAGATRYERMGRWPG